MKHDEKSVAELMERDYNIYTKELFAKDYKDRSWKFYRNVFAECILFGEPGRWLDLGAGCGFFVECAYRFGITCIGLEGSHYAVSKAKSRCPGIDMRQHFLPDDLPFEDNSISTVMCYQVIEHIDRQTAIHMLAECHRVLKPQGVILIFSPSKYNHSQAKDQSHINLYTPKALKFEVEQAGFHVSSTRNTPRSFGKSFPSRLFATALYFLFPFDWLSESANCIGIKSD